MSALLPIPQIDVNVRVATPDDVPFIDRLQKMHSKRVGFMQTKAIEGKIAAGEVLIAENKTDSPLRHADAEGDSDAHADSRITGLQERELDCAAMSNVARACVPECLRGESLGYVIGTDRYFKHDDVGIIYQLNVAPGHQRGFVGATLLKAMFDRAAYGCRLFCCWCAQDIDANRFWEAMGFVPLAYRAGSEKRLKGGRVHIFWQKRIRSGDDETPWWFPSQTTGGAIRADRLVLPIPPGTHWSDAKPVLLPGEEPLATRQLPPPVKEKSRQAKDDRSAGRPAAKPAPQLTPKLTPQLTPQLTPKLTPVTRMSGLNFGSTQLTAGDVPKEPNTAKAERKPRACPERSRGETKPKVKNDPKLVAVARELKDRWLEHLNGGGEPVVLTGKYDVSRTLGSVEGTRVLETNVAPVVKQLSLAA